MKPFTSYTRKDITANTIMCLDFEVTSFWVHNGRVENWDKNKPDSYYNEECEKGSCVYIWMFGIDEDIYYGRELKDLKDFLYIIKDDSKLKEKEHLTIFCHNFAYEFQFLRNILSFSDVFARQLRKPMKASWDIFTFRCSYVMANLSLASWGKQVGIKKLVGDLDYNMIRTPRTPIFDYELDYCEHDIMVMTAGIRKEIERYKNIKSIPLTSTGKVRKVVRGIYKKNSWYLHKVTNLLPKTPDEYKISKQVFGGGDTHANAKNVNKTCENAAGKDIGSSYPYVMVTMGYPWSEFIETTQRDGFDFDRFCYIFALELTDVKLRGTISYLARSRCVSVVNGVYDNGRIVSADRIVLYCTEIDKPYIEYFYDAEIKYINVRKAIKKPLRKEYVNYILDLYGDKTSLKGIVENFDFYTNQKAFLNALYGMMVTDIVMSEIKYENEDWQALPQFQKDIQTSLTNLQDKWYKNILSYNWGIWVTCHARASLWDAIMAIIEAGGSDDIIYFDTDSLKYMHPEKYEEVFRKLNQERWERCLKAANRYKIPVNKFQPMDPKGIKRKIGQWEDDGQYKKFKTLGAKKYLYEDESGLHLTVSGVPKKAVKCLKSFDDFREGFVFDNDTCRKGLATYLEPNGTNNYLGPVIDGWINDQQYGLNLRNTGYTLGLTGEFKKYLQSLNDWGNFGGNGIE